MIKTILISDSYINEINIKTNNISDETIYKKCNLKSNINFIMIKEWEFNDNIIELWGKTKGIQKFKSSFDFFIKNDLNIYGKSIFIMKNKNKEFVSLIDSDFEHFLNENNKISELNEKNNNISVEGERIETNEDNEDNEDNESVKSLGSELQYEIYNYSSDENSE